VSNNVRETHEGNERAWGDPITAGRERVNVVVAVARPALIAAQMRDDDGQRRVNHVSNGGQRHDEDEKGIWHSPPQRCHSEGRVFGSEAGMRKKCPASREEGSSSSRP